MTKLAGKLCGSGAPLRLCYEVDPCGYGVYRQMRALGHECAVVTPSLILRLGDRIKTDRRDALSLARLNQKGELTSAWVPDKEWEAIRSRVFTGGRRWTRAH